ncbi:MAG: YbaK/EbsC family protein [Synergistaceae bacterium]|jgi:prolyl-tRNA editing enzyme YbaK/EbsC (Cys-tRNA(Pro) deacylase)|nr:YbaK/EbsC family protein [Synergistaceae bacterium]
MDLAQISDPVGKVRAFLESVSYDKEIVHTDETIFTVTDASRVVGAPPEEILKSLLFRVETDAGEEWTLALMSGSNRVHDKAIKRILGARKIRMGTADAIREFSGFEPGGVPPVGYPAQPRTLLDRDLFKYATVWSAAGSDHDFFPISPGRLLEITGGTAEDIKKYDYPIVS